MTDEERARDRKVHALVCAFIEWCHKTGIDSTADATVRALEAWGDYEWGVLAQAAKCRPPNTSRALVLERLRTLQQFATRKPGRK